MRIQLITLICLLSFNALAGSDKEMKELFFKYDAVMDAQKVELIDEVFSKKFLREVGGKDEFIANIKELPKKDEKSLKAPRLSWKKGTKDEIFFAKRFESSDLKAKEAKAKHSGSSFIVIKEDGKLKIDGTISDDH